MAEGRVNYRIMGVLGEGGFGKVYRARMETSEGFSKEVAIKVLHDEQPPRSLLKRFRDESRILGLLRDRAIVGVEPPIQLDGRWAVVMEFVDGVSCGQIISTQGSVPAGVAAEIVGEIARAIHNAYHQEGPDGPLHLLHRDIKPDNIQVTQSGDIRLLDFGIARANFGAREFKTKRSLGGTPGYIAPERVQGIEVPRGDVFSLGVVLHELVTGERPTFTPTVNLDELGEGTPHIDPQDLEIDDPAMLGDPEAMKVLELAGWMRAYEPEQRPTARQVEERCRELRFELPRPFLRDWAEEKVPARVEMGTDERVGRTLSLQHGVAAASMPPANGTTALQPTPPPALAAAPPAASDDRITGYVAGAFSMLLLGVIGIGAVVIVLLLTVVAIQQLSTPTPTPDPAPVDVAPPPVDPQPDPVPVDEPLPQPLPVPVSEPTPTSPAPAPPRVITLEPGVQPEPVGSTPAPTPSPSPAPNRATGLVVVKTVPSGAVVKERGVALVRSGPGYRLTPGIHTLQIVSPSGETETIPVQVNKDERVDICYSFDSNSKCGG